MHLGAALRFIVIEVELLIGLGGFTAYQTLINSECYNFYSAVRAWVLRSMSERERTQTTSQGPQIYTKLFQRGPIALTARMLAWKQPFIQRVRNSSLVERFGMDNNRAQTYYRSYGLYKWQGSIPVVLKVNCEVCWNGWKRKCRHKQRQCGRETRTPKDQGFLSYANQLRVSRDLRRTRKGQSMDNRLIFLYPLSLKVTEANIWCVLTEQHVEASGNTAIVHQDFGCGDNPENRLPRKTRAAARTLNRHRQLG
eukprot:TRINITY_DN665_c0_g1_i2.p1 TRINITY_DN665_c0_g1~~TRINITY_DN665_c0_g1_i2.p1  ORF type:complete len:253 (-),score=1.77 TRINITY_DN665_c0_g1_i2:80-838(-)